MDAAHPEIPYLAVAPFVLIGAANAILCIASYLVAARVPPRVADE